MTGRCIVGLLDSGVSRDTHCHAATRIALDAQGACVYSPDSPDRLGHGAAIARIILAGAPGTKLVSAQIFHDTLTTSPALIARGLHWTMNEGARLIVMALGVRADRAVLAEACQTALAAGGVLVAAAPARGRPVYPAHYDGVISAMGDARCGPGDISALMTSRAHFGAAPQADDILGANHPLRGASCATARIAARLAAQLEIAPHASARDLMERLAQSARFQGPEQRRV